MSHGPSILLVLVLTPTATLIRPAKRVGMDILATFACRRRPSTRG